MRNNVARQRIAIVPLTGLFILAFSALSCGDAFEAAEPNPNNKRAKDHVERYRNAQLGESSDAVARLNANPRVIIPPIQCNKEKTDLEFANAVTQNLYNRDVIPAEISRINSGDFDRETFVDEALASDQSDTGITKFVTNLFVLGGIKPKPELEDAALEKDITLISHLKQEPVQLVLRNKDKPWKWFFTTREIFCTSLTAELYDFPLVNTDGFVNCSLPEDRAGFLGLASVLRAIPSDFISTNNNYKRVAFAVYLAQGFRLLSATNGPEGEGPGQAMPDCVPTTDMRRDPEGLAYGTALVPTEGNVCASCHSSYNAPMSIAFRRFNTFGERYTFEEIDRLDNDERHGSSADYLKRLLNENNSCWSFDKVSPPRTYNGQPGLSRLIAESGTLGKALGSQIPQMLGNIEPDANMVASVEKGFYDGGETLMAGMKGFLMSDSFQCAEKAE